MKGDIGDAARFNTDNLTKLSEDIDLNPDLADLLVNNSNHFDAWASIEFLSSTYRGNAIAIREVKRLKDDLYIWQNSTNWAARAKTVYYHLYGFVKGSQVSGGHLRLQSSSTTVWGDHIIVVINPGTSRLSQPDPSIQYVAFDDLPTDVNGVQYITDDMGISFFVAKYSTSSRGPDFNIITHYQQKGIPLGQTLFPSDWTYQRTIEEIASDRANPQVNSWGTNAGWSSGLRAASESGIVIRWFDLPNKEPSSYFPERLE